MSLDMEFFIGDVFESVPATRSSQSGEYIDGIYVPGVPVASSHRVNLQPLSDREIQLLEIGAERIIDVRRVYVNDGDLYSITPSDTWSFTGIDGTYEAISLDNRPWRNYCKLIISRQDDSG